MDVTRKRVKELLVNSKNIDSKKKTDIVRVLSDNSKACEKTKTYADKTCDYNINLDECDEKELEAVINIILNSNS